MKSILLASASVFAFAGAAAADGHAGVSFGGSATVGYNDVLEDGFYFDGNLAVTYSAALDNGLTAGVTFDIDVADDDGSIALDSGNFLVTLSSDMATLSFGDIDPSAEGLWSGVDGSEVAGFNDYDTHIDTAGFEAVLRGDVNWNGWMASVSFGADVDGGNDLTGEVIDAAQAYVSGSFGAFGVMAAFQQEFGPTPQIIAVGASASFAGADIMVAFEQDGTETSYGASVAYPIGPVALGAYATQNDVAGLAWGVSADYASGPITVAVAYDVDAGDDAGEGTAALDASYALGNGITILAGAEQSLVTDAPTLFYGAGSVDLGGGATFLLSYADDGIDNNQGDELGGPEYKEGLTAELSFTF